MPETGEVHEREANVIEWTMRDFFSLPAREGLCFSSPKFPLDGAEWYLCMYPNGERTEESKGYIVIYLLRISYDSPIQQNLSLGVKTSKNEIVEDKRPIHNYKNATYQHKWPRFMKMYTLLERQSELVPSGHLTLVCRKKNPPSTDAIGDIPTDKCAYCKETMNAGRLPSHERKCLERPIECPECWEVVALKHRYAHGCQPAQSKGYSASAPQSQSYSGSPGDGSYGSSAPSGYGSQPPNSGVGSSTAPASAYGAGAPPSTGASAIPPVGPPSHDPPVHGTASPPGGYGGPPPGADYNRPPGRHDGSPAPGGPGPMPGGPGGDYASPTGYGGPGGRDGFEVNNKNLLHQYLKHREIYLLYVLNPGMAIVGEVNTRDQSIFVIEWTIRNFFSLPSEVKTCHSPLFSFGGADWRLKVYPYGQKEKNSEGNIDVYLIRYSAGPPIDMKYSFSLKQLDNKMHTLKYYEFTFKQKLHFHGSLNLVNRSELLERKSEFSSSDQLTWVCQIVSTDCSSDNSASAGMDKFLEHLKHPFLNHQNCDVVLRVQGRDFQAHKVILRAHSHVFASLFQNDVKEKATAIVDIDDCSPSTFSDFLHFLYCQETDRLSKENVLSLLAVSDKYGVSELRIKCLEFIKEKISAHTFGDTLASCHSETESIQLAAA